MKKILVPLLVLVLLCMSVSAPAEGNSKITLQVNTGSLPVYKAGDPHLTGLTSHADDDTMPMLVIPAKKGYQIRVTVQPATVRNKKVNMSVADKTIVRVNGSNVTGLKAGETVLKIASAQDPSVSVQYRIIVTQPVTRITINATDKKVAAGGSMTLKASIMPLDATNKKVTWSSSNPQTASVDADGKVTGLKRGNVRITALATDGSNIRANINIQVVQSAEKITLDRSELTVDAGRTGVLRATVLPRDANDKNVVWTSSNERIARVNAQGRVTGVSLGDCEIICTSKLSKDVQARATVHVQQPVKSISFGNVPAIYAGETGQLTWKVEPANASNQGVVLSSSNERILRVSQDGTVTGIQTGEAYVRAVTVDGSNRQAKVKVRVLQHVTGVRMKRKVAYVDVKQTSTAGTIFEPEKATNHNMTWESADTSVATVEPEAKQSNRVRITGVSRGETVVTGTTEDGGFQASILVRIGDWEKSLKLTDAYVRGADAHLTVKNTGSLNVTSITAEVSVFDNEGKPVPCNSKDNSNTFQMVYKKTLTPNSSTKESEWKTVNFKLPESMTVWEYVVKVTEFEIDHDWIKVIRKNNQPTKKCPVHL